MKEKSKKEENQTWATNGSSILQEAGPQGESLKMLRRMCKRQKVVREQVICILERRKRGKEPLDVLSKSSSKEAVEVKRTSNGLRIKTWLRNRGTLIKAEDMP